MAGMAMSPHQGARDLQHAEQGDEHRGNQRDPQPVNREHVHRAGAQKRLADVAGERRAPAQRHRTKQAQRLVSHRQAERESNFLDQFKKRSVNGGKLISRGFKNFPVVCGFGFELVIKSRASGGNPGNRKGTRPAAAADAR